MADEERLLVEQDPTIAKVAETSLRMMAGSVGAATRRAVQAELDAHPEAYPWHEVCDLVVREAVDPSDLVNRGIVAQRDWWQRGPRGAPRAAPGPRPAKSGSAATFGKRLLAIALVRGSFYTAFAGAFALILLLVERKWGFDIYAAGRSLEEFVRGLFGG